MIPESELRVAQVVRRWAGYDDLDFGDRTWWKQVRFLSPKTVSTVNLRQVGMNSLQLVICMEQVENALFGSFHLSLAKS